jgi:hypothetical protein
VFAQESIVKKFAVAAITLSALLSGCVAYEVPNAPDPGMSYAHRDRDRDGIANRHDRDRDGDGVRNSRDARPDNPYRY